MQIKDVMVRDVKTCVSADCLSRAAQLMWENDCGVVPVIDADERVVGMITDRDACMAAYTKGRPLSEIRVDEVMSRDVKTCRSEDTVADVEAKMRMQRVRRVPVTDPLGHLTGIVSLNDLARAAADPGNAANGLARAEVAETLASICRPWCDLAAQPAPTVRASSVAKASAVLVPQRSR